MARKGTKQLSTSQTSATGPNGNGRPCPSPQAKPVGPGEQRPTNPLPDGEGHPEN